MPKRADIKSVMVIGSGPIVIGQAAEFDYSGTQACRVLHEEGIRVILVNSNPATIMTDPELADATYIEPIDTAILELVTVWGKGRHVEDKAVEMPSYIRGFQSPSGHDFLSIFQKHVGLNAKQRKKHRWIMENY